MSPRILALALLVLGCDDVEASPHASSVDAGLRDGGERDDAGVSEDAGLIGDAGAIEDGGIPGGDSGVDGGAGDAGSTDAGPVDAGSTDAGPVDAGPTDAGSTDAGRADAGDACHGYTFGAPAVPIQNVPSLSWTGAGGGTIPLGTYDAVSAESTGTLSGMYRATWVFEDASTLAQLQQITLSGPGPVTPRRFAWSTAGDTLTRIETCPGSDSYNQSYRVRTEGAQTFLDVRQSGALIFTYRRR